MRIELAGCSVTLMLAMPCTGQRTIHAFDGQSPGDVLGISVSSAGDVDADGVVDVVAGAHRSAVNGYMSGSAYVYSGANGQVLHSYFGATAGDELGRTVAGAGDVDGDGHADVIIGSVNDDTRGINTGAVFVYSGRTGARLHAFYGVNPGEGFGISVAGAGDANGDGYDDIVIGARLADWGGFTDNGAMFLYSGRDGVLLHRFSGEGRNHQLGHSVSGAGDVNADGFDDVIGGAYMAEFAGTMSGSAYVFSGRDGRMLYRFDGDQPRDWFGIAVSDAGDVDFDGFADVIVGAMWADSNGRDSGSARVYSGIDGSTLHVFHGDAPHDYFGSSVAAAGDVDGDGFRDLIVGAYGDDFAAPNGGSARILSGFDGRRIHTHYGLTASELLGQSVHGAGDLTGDGLDDVVFGAGGYDATGNDNGRVTVLDVGSIATAGVTRVHGTACPGTGGRLPRLDVAGAAETGLPIVVRLRGGLPHANVALHVGRATHLPLDALGMVGCTSYVDPVVAFRFQSDWAGYLRALLFVPNDPTISGMPFEMQWVVEDPGAPYAVGATLSDALSVILGN